VSEGEPGTGEAQLSVLDSLSLVLFDDGGGGILSIAIIRAPLFFRELLSEDPVIESSLSSNFKFPSSKLANKK
jgi:hypothetical protein